jgi:hypothetical protein
MSGLPRPERYRPSKPLSLACAWGILDRNVTVKTDQARQRFLIALKWATFAEGSDDASFALRALTYVVKLLGRTATIGYNINRQMEVLQEACGLSCRAAIVAISAGHVPSAIELLEP